MLKYLKAAFWAAPGISGLGRVPVNAIGLTGFGILGFGHPGFWLAGASLEAAYLYALSMSPRFRRLVDAQERTIEETDVAAQRQKLITQLEPAAREELRRLEAKCERILELHRDNQAEDFTIDGNREALQKLTWLFLKLLLAQQNLRSMEPGSGEQKLKQQLASIEKGLEGGNLSPSLRESKEATRSILRQRLENLERRAQTLSEIESDLIRIEAQVDLAADTAGMRGKPEMISSRIDLVSHLLDDSIYGDSSASIAALEDTYGSARQ